MLRHPLLHQLSPESRVLLRQPPEGVLGQGPHAATTIWRRPQLPGGHLNLCDQAIEQQLENLAAQFNDFPVNRLRAWQDQEGRDFDPTRPMLDALTISVAPTPGTGLLSGLAMNRCFQRSAVRHPGFHRPGGPGAAPRRTDCMVHQRNGREFRQAADGSWYRAY